MCVVDNLIDFAGTGGANIKVNNSGGYNGEVTPVPIPNTEVKLSSAEDTWLATARENMSLPDLYSSIAQSVEHAAVNRRVVGSSPT
jgi:hypothetical protein